MLCYVDTYKLCGQRYDKRITIIGSLSQCFPSVILAINRVLVGTTTGIAGGVGEIAGGVIGGSM